MFEAEILGLSYFFPLNETFEKKETYMKQNVYVLKNQNCKGLIAP